MGKKARHPVLPRGLFKKKIKRIRQILRMSKQEWWEEQQRVVAPHMAWNRSDFYTEAFEKYGLEVSGCPEIRNYFLQSSLRSVEGLGGDVAECGTRNGKSALYMLTACQTNRPFWLFDSFEGLSDPSPEKDGLTSVMDSTGEARIFKVDYSKIEERFAPFENVTLMQGWIPERFPEVEDRKFCFVHVDVDLYEPTWDAYSFFYDRMLPGGMMVCDDYGSTHFPGAREAVDTFFADKPETPVELPQGQCFIVKR